jgi:hypothetical protein
MTCGNLCQEVRIQKLTKLWPEKTEEWKERCWIKHGSVVTYNGPNHNYAEHETMEYLALQSGITGLGSTLFQPKVVLPSGLDWYACSNLLPTLEMFGREYLPCPAMTTNALSMSVSSLSNTDESPLPKGRDLHRRYSVHSSPQVLTLPHSASVAMIVAWPTCTLICFCEQDT